MNDIIETLWLDVANQDYQAAINVRQADNARKLVFVLSENGKPYTIPTDVSIKFRAEKPDGTVIYNNCTIVDNTVEYKVTNQTTAIFGTVRCELNLYKTENENITQITTPKFYMNVEKTVYQDSEIESTDEFTALQEAIAETENLDISASKVGNKTTVTVTKKDGTVESAEIMDGEKGDKGDKGDTGTTSWNELTDKPSAFPPSSHNHDEIYYTEAEINELLASKISGAKIAGIQAIVEDNNIIIPPASSTNAGVIKTSTRYGSATIPSSCEIFAYNTSAENYPSASDNMFLAKGTNEAIKNTYVKEGMLENTTLTSTEKATIRDNIGAEKANKTWELINSITLSEAATEVDITTDSNGHLFSLESCMIETISQPTGAGSNTHIRCFLNTGNYDSYLIAENSLFSSSVRYGLFGYYKIGNGLIGLVKNDSSEYGNNPFYGSGNLMGIKNFDNIYKIIVQAYSSSIPLPAGSIINVYGIRK